ncbi:MAG: hypothetical protein H7837_07570 [Magnetococcus sp. MYC-9]
MIGHDSFPWLAFGHRVACPAVQTKQEDGNSPTGRTESHFTGHGGTLLSRDETPSESRTVGFPDRMDFTPSERVAIGRAVEEFLGNRWGQRTDLAGSELPKNFGEVKPGKETAELAAQKAGFNNPETYRQAKAVVANGTPELVEAMDRGEVAAGMVPLGREVVAVTDSQPGW